jgi:hypothetical protein
MRLFLFLFGLTAISAFSQCEDFSVDISVYEPTCYGFTDGSITLTASGGIAPYEYEISDADGNILGLTPTANILGTGWYYYTVIDADGCEVVDSVFLDQPPQLTIDYTTVEPTSPEACDGSITIDSVYGEYESIVYFWSPGELGFEETTEELCYGSYVLTINTEAGCSATFDFELSLWMSVYEEEKAIDVIVDGKSILIQAIDIPAYYVEIYSLSGQSLHKDLSPRSGVCSIELNLSNGLYLYRIISEKKVIQQGRVVF